MDNQNNFDEIEQFVTGKAGDKEISIVESMFLDGENNLYLRNRLYRDWDEMLGKSESNDVSLDHILDKVHHTISRNERSGRQKPLRKILNVYCKAAAILLLPMVIGGVLLHNILNDRNITVADQQSVSTIYAPMGSRVDFNLPDGTKGMLNSGSYLTYSIPFSEKRNIKLDGEAWFEVKSDEKHPFKIDAGNSVIKVLGTKFNLSAYPAEKYIEVVLLEGKVEFENPEDKNIVSILPSERLVFKDGSTIKTTTDPFKYNAWTEGKLVFRGDPTYEVARRIERWYNVKINIADPELERYSFRATFQDDTLEDVLKYLSMTSPMDYKISPRELEPDGSFKKVEVMIYKRK